ATHRRVGIGDTHAGRGQVGTRRRRARGGRRIVTANRAADQASSRPEQGRKLTNAAFPELPAPLASELSEIDSCSLCNAIEATGTRPRDEGFTDGTIRCLFDRLPPMLGYAFTLRVSTGHPKVRELRYVDHVDWAPALLALPEPRILVVENIGADPSRGAVLGEVHASIFRALGVAG